MRKLVLLITFSLFLNCKEELSIGKGFILNSPIQIFKKPDRNSQAVKAVQVLSEVDILKMQVPDKNNDKLFWFKVRSGDIKGFISYDEEVLKQNFVSIKPQAGNRKALIMATLHLREKPTQKSTSIGLLTTSSVVDIVSEGSLRVTIDDITETWINIRTTDNKVGFVFGGYVRRGDATDFDSKEKIGQALVWAGTEKGWLLVTADRPHFDSADGCKSGDQKDLLPKKNDIVDIRGKRHDGQKVFYLIAAYAGESNACEDHYIKWIPAENVEYISNLYEFTKKMNTTVPAATLDFVNTHLNHKLDARSVMVRNVKLRNEKDPGVEYLEISAPEGVSSLGNAPQAPKVLYVAKQGDQLSLVAKFVKAELQDLDGDGNMELISNVTDRGGLHLYIYSYKPGQGFQQVFMLEYYHAQATIESPYIIIENPVFPEQPNYKLKNSGKPLTLDFSNDQLVRVFKFAQGTFNKVSLSPKYVAYNKELKGRRSKDF